MIGIRQYNQLCKLFPELPTWVLTKNADHILFGPKKAPPTFPLVALQNVIQVDGRCYICVPWENSLVIADTKQSDPHRALEIFYLLQASISFCNDYQKEKTRANIVEEQSSFLSQYLFNHFAPDDQDFIALLAEKTKINFEQKRIVCLFDIPPKEKAEVCDFIICNLKLHPSCCQDDIIYASDEMQPVLCKTFENFSNWQGKIQKIIAPLITTVQTKYNLEVKCGISMPVDNIFDYPDSYYEAKSVLQFMRLWNEGHNIGYIEDYSLPYEMMLIPENEIPPHFKEQYHLLKSEPYLLDTVRSLVRNNMDIKSAAAALGVHKNTVALRIRELRTLLEFDFIHTDSGRARLAMIYYCGVLR